MLLEEFLDLAVDGRLQHLLGSPAHDLVQRAPLVMNRFRKSTIPGSRDRVASPLAPDHIVS
jgi:hypothetical protein